MGAEITTNQTVQGTLHFAPGSSLTTDGGVVIDLSDATLKLPASAIFTPDTGNGGAVGLVPAPAAGDGAAKKFLTARGTWENPDPITTQGDLIFGGVGGVAMRLPKGVDGQVLTLAAGLPAWATPAPSTGGGGGGGTASGSPDAPAAISTLVHRWNAQALAAGALASWQEVAGYGSPLTPEDTAANVAGKSVVFAGGGRYKNAVAISGSFSVWMAVRPTGSRSEGLLSFGSGTTDGWRLTVGADGSATLTTPNVADYPLSGTPLAIGAWHSVAVVFSVNGNISAWIDGQQCTYTGGAPASVAMGSFAVAGTADLSNALNGSVGEVCLFSDVLTAAQIASLNTYFNGGSIYS